MLINNVWFYVCYANSGVCDFRGTNSLLKTVLGPVHFCFRMFYDNKVVDFLYKIQDAE